MFKIKLIPRVSASGTTRPLEEFEAEINEFLGKIEDKNKKDENGDVTLEVVFHDGVGNRYDTFAAILYDLDDGKEVS